MSSFLFQLHELQDRNAECLGMLHESQEEVKLLRSRASSVACLCHPQACGTFPVVTNTAAMVYTYWHKWPGVNSCYLQCRGNHFVIGKEAEFFIFLRCTLLSVHLSYLVNESFTCHFMILGWLFLFM